MTLGISKAAQEIKWPRLKDVGEAGTYRKIRVVDLKNELISEFLYYIFDKYNTTQHPKIKDLPFILEKAEQANPEFKDKIQNSAKLAMKTIKNMTISDVQKNRGIDFNLPEKLKEYILQLKVKDMIDYDVDELFDTAEYSPDEKGKSKAKLRRGEIQGLSGNEYASHFKNIYKEKIDDSKLKKYERRKEQFLEMPEKTKKEREEKEKLLDSISRMEINTIKTITIDESKSNAKENKLKKLGYKFLNVTSLSSGEKGEYSENLTSKGDSTVSPAMLEEYKRANVNVDKLKNIVAKIESFEKIDYGVGIDDLISEIIDYLKHEDYSGSRIPKETIRLFRKYAFNVKSSKKYYETLFEQIKDRNAELKVVFDLDKLADIVDEFSSILKEEDMVKTEKNKLVETEIFNDLESDLLPFVRENTEIENVLIDMELGSSIDTKTQEKVKENLLETREKLEKIESKISDKEADREKIKDKRPEKAKEITKEIQELTNKRKEIAEKVNLILEEYKPMKLKLDSIKKVKTSGELIRYLTSGNKEERSKRVDAFIKSLDNKIDEEIKENKRKNKILENKLNLESPLVFDMDEVDELMKTIQDANELNIVFNMSQRKERNKEYLMEYYKIFKENPSQDGLEVILDIVSDLKELIIDQIEKKEKKAEKEGKGKLRTSAAESVYDNEVAKNFYIKKDDIEKEFSSLLTDLSGKYKIKLIIKQTINLTINDEEDNGEPKETITDSDFKEKITYSFLGGSQYTRFADIGYRRVPKGKGGGDDDASGFKPFPRKFISTETKIDKLTQRNLDRLLQKIKIKIENLEDSI